MADEVGVVGIPDNNRVVMTGPRFAAHYWKHADSWTHKVDIVGIFHAIEVACAFESDPRLDQPERVVSPVFQEAHRHDPDGAVGLLLTGNWFQHHFSAAVSVSADPADIQTAILDVDVADRCRAPVEFFAATYVVRLDSGALVEAGPAKIVWRVEGPNEGTLELVAVDSAALSLAEAGRAATRVQVVAAIEPGKFTHRLRYQWRWASR